MVPPPQAHREVEDLTDASSARETGRTESPMPANFGEIGNYHTRLAAQYLALAQKAREAGDHNAAEYNHQLAARYVEAAQEQKIAMSQVPGHAAVQPTPRPWAQQSKPAPKRAASTAPKAAPKPILQAAPKRAPLAAACFSALCRGAGSLAAALQQSLLSADASLQGLSLQDAPPVPEQ